MGLFTRKFLRRKGNFERKQAAARESGNRYYGDGGTIHNTTSLSVELDPKTGEVASIWYRCLLLPFHTYTWQDPVRANPKTEIHGIEITDE